MRFVLQTLSLCLHGRSVRMKFVLQLLSVGLLFSYVTSLGFTPLTGTLYVVICVYLYLSGRQIRPVHLLVSRRPTSVFTRKAHMSRRR